MKKDALKANRRKAAHARANPRDGASTPLALRDVTGRTPSPIPPLEGQPELSDSAVVRGLASLNGSAAGSAPQDLQTAMGGPKVRREGKAKWLGRVMDRWMEREKFYDGNHPVFEVVKATMGVANATSAVFGASESVMDLSKSEAAEPEDSPRDDDEGEAFSQSFSRDTSYATASGMLGDSGTAGSPKNPTRAVKSSVRQAVNHAKNADRLWANRAISLLPLASIGKPRPLQKKEWRNAILKPKDLDG